MRQESDTKQRLLSTALDMIWDNSYGTVSVDDICGKAGVLKGSFYHFFHSKSDLAAASLDAYWDQYRKPQLDAVFAADVSPEERFLRYTEQIYLIQKERFEKKGRVCGCPINSLGSELSTQDEKIRKKSQEISTRVRHFYETALTDGQKQGLWTGVDVPAKALELYSMVTGTLVQARINNDIHLIKSLKPAIARLLGIEEKAAA